MDACDRALWLRYHALMQPQTPMPETPTPDSAEVELDTPEDDDDDTQPNVLPGFRKDA